jgi:YegS/Rv2252/BmrU family lipid kinase
VLKIVNTVAIDLDFTNMPPHRCDILENWMTQQVKLIFNPHADKGNAWRLASTLQNLIERQGGASWVSTEYPGHATELTNQAAREGYSIVTALGGDGTVHEIVNGLMQTPSNQRPKLAVVPLGSGNDFANNVGIEMDIEKAMIRVFGDDIKAIDIGKITDQSGVTEYWDNTMGIGFDGSATIRASKITRLQGFPMYLLAVIQTILKHHDVAQMTIETDTETIEQDVLMITLCNGPREGGGFHVAPDAVADDGILDYAMIEGVSRLMMFRLIPEVMNGTHGRFKQVRIGRSRSFKISYDRPLAIHTDGEVFAGFTSDIRELTVEVLPKAIDVIR